MDDLMSEDFEQFLAEQDEAVEQLRLFVGGELGKKLDGSFQSLALLDRFITTLTLDPHWRESPLFGDSKDVETWLVIRIAYYVGAVLNQAYGAEWSQVRDSTSPIYGAPVIRLQDIELNPLHIATEYLHGAVQGGLQGLLRDLEVELRRNL